MALAVNPTASTFPTRQTYVAPWEFLNAPTGVDINQLVPGGTVSANQAALVMQLQRASQYADNACQKILAATVDTQHGRYPIRSDAWLGPVVRVPLDYTPIVAVSAVSWGWTPSTMTALTDLSNLDIGQKVVTVPIYPSFTTLSGPYTVMTGSQALVNVSYVNGWANTALTANAAPGSTSLSVATDLGIVPGQQLRLANANAQEVVTVASTYTPTANNTPATVPLTAGTVGNYTTGDLASALPQDIKQAVILIAKELIRTRASSTIVMGSIGGDTPGHEQHLQPGVSSDLDMALDLLAPYRRPV